MDDLISRQAAMDKINQLTKWYYETFHEKRPTTVAVIDALMDLPSADAQPVRWIPCTERIPDTEDKVLCCTVTKKGLKGVVVGYYLQGHGWVCGMNSNVVAWMSLPEPYEGE